ncbi:MAG: phosphoribosylamine--glycine ligase, partial [Candidatus Rokuibacteriota bacterium]
SLVRLASVERTDLVVIGPEAPLVAGLTDRLVDKGLTVFGPSARAARIEGSKAFAKSLMVRHGIPTARFETFDDPAEARAHCRAPGPPLVVKADGLTAGKGVSVCRTLAEADTAVARCMERGEFGASGSRIVIEECLEGEEYSFFAISNGVDAIPIAGAQDHKTVFDGDAGPNTGGMGAFSPVASVDAALDARIMREIVEPTLAALAADGAPYRGVLYAGLMLTREGPKVIEFNCRFGDPECQVIMPRLEGDLVPALAAAARGEPLGPLRAHPARAAVCVALASPGYPGAYPTGAGISGVEAAEAIEGVQVFHAGTALKDGRLVTAGGRVLGVTAVAASVDRAIGAAYEAIGRIRFEGMHYRRDIGKRPQRQEIAP